MYEKYKANRKGMPDELASQMPILKEILKAMNITILEKEGYEVRSYYTYEQASIHTGDDDVHLWILDIMLDDKSGFDLIEEIRLQGKDIPVIFMSARDKEFDRIIGLEKGSDDYITKPFRIRELLSRIKSVFRRYNKQAAAQPKTNIAIENVRINTLEGKVYKNGEEVLLTALEYRLFLIFANHIGQTLTRSQLLDRIWDVAGDFVNDNTLTVYIKRLREKLEDNPQSPTIIKTVRGMGYRVGE